MNDGTIECITPLDKEAIITLHEKYLNYGPGVTRYINGIFERNAYIGYKYISDNQIRGVALLEDGIVFTVPHPALAARIRADFPDSVIYSLASYLVCPEYAGHHIGATLIRRCLEDLKHYQNHKLLVEMWVYPDNTKPAVGLERLIPSFTRYGHIPHFYKGQEQYGFYCPVCHEKCVCGAEIVLFHLNESERCWEHEKGANLNCKIQVTV